MRRADRVVPLFVLDDGLLATDFARPNRVRFLLDTLADLEEALQAAGGALVLRRGDVVREAVGVAREARAHALLASADVSAYAQRREARLAQACREASIAFQLFPGVTVVEPRAARPRGRRPSPDVARGGESRGRARFEAWLRAGLAHYAERHDDLAADDTSRLSPYIHFGCLSPVELARRADERPGGEAFARQLCWRDFHHQVTAAFAAIARADYRPRGDRWDDDAAALAAWQAGRTGFPLVDARALPMPPAPVARDAVMEVMRRRFRFALALMAWLPVAATALAAQDTSPAPVAPEPPPGVPAPAHVVTEIQQSLDDAVRRFGAMDGAGVLAHVSEQYRTGPLTKVALAEQLRAIFAIHDQVTARVRIDEVRMVDERAWVYSTGDVAGRLRFIGGSMPVLSWQRELEVARRENGRWRLFGYQQ